MIMYSFGVAGETECSKASAGRENRSRQRGPCIRCRRGRMRRGRIGWVPDDEEEDVRPPDEEPERER